MDVNKKPTWSEAIKIARNFSDHYSLTEPQQKLIYKYASRLPKGSTIMELGVCNGKTSAILAYLAKQNGYRAYGVDDFSLEWNPIAFKEKMTSLDLPFELIVGKTNEVLWEEPIDFLLIDAGHDPANIYRDTNRWIPFVKVGGYVAFHDYEDPYDIESPHWGVRYFADKTTGAWDNIGSCDKLKIRQQPQKLNNFVFNLKGKGW